MTGRSAGSWDATGKAAVVLAAALMVVPLLVVGTRGGDALAPLLLGMPLLAVTVTGAFWAAGPGQRERATPQTASATTLPAWAIGAGAVAVVALLLANGAIDQRRPNVGATGVLLAVAAAAGLAAVAAGAATATRWRSAWPPVVGALAGAAAAVPAFWVGTSYGSQSGGFLADIEGTMGTAALAYLFAIVALGALAIASAKGRRSLLAFTGWGLGIGAAVAGVAAYMLATLPEQAAEAARANRPAPSMAVALVAVLVLAAAWRRSRGAR